MQSRQASRGLTLAVLPDGGILHLCLLSFKLPICFCLGIGTLSPFPFALVSTPLHSKHLAYN